MKTITKYIILLMLSFYVINVTAQDTIVKTKASSIASLKESIKSEERDALKIEVEEINKRVTDKEITYEEAEDLKEAAAKKRALNIENRLIILDNTIALRERNNITSKPVGKNFKKTFEITFGGDDNEAGITYKTTKPREPVKYDIRTSNDMVMAIGFNNAIIDGQSLSDSPYKLGGSGFVELGWNWKTRLAKDSNFARLKYGFSFQWNKYDIKDNQFFTQEGSNTTLATAAIDLDKSKFRTTNLIVPLYFEFGGWEKTEKKDRIRFNTYDKFKFGIGGYAGVNIGSRQKIKYKEDGDRVKQKLNGNFDVNPFVYGVGAYIGIGDLSLYAKYDLSETFKNDALKQNNISLGFRVDLD